MCIKMSDVRLSNASPTLERVDARLPDNLRLPVCRNLFGRPDPGEIQRNAAAAVREDVQAFRERYNFDPVEDRPLAPRAFAWEEEWNPPEFYLRPPHGAQGLRGEGEPPPPPQQQQLQRPLEFDLQPPHGIRRPRGEEEPQPEQRRSLGRSQPRLAGGANQADSQAAPGRSRKRRSGDLGPCSGECQGKSSRTGEDDDDEDPSNGAMSQVGSNESDRPARPESGAEVQ